MISTELLRILSTDREREIESNLRVRALLGRRRPHRTKAVQAPLPRASEAARGR